MNQKCISGRHKSLSHTLSHHLLAQKLDAVMLPAIEKKRCMLTRKGNVFEKKFVNTIIDAVTPKHQYYNTASTESSSKNLFKAISKPEMVFNSVSTTAKIRYIDDMGIKLKSTNAIAANEKRDIKTQKWNIVDRMQKDTFFATKMNEVDVLKRQLEATERQNTKDTEDLKNKVKRHSRELAECYAKYNLLLQKYEMMNSLKGVNSSL